MILATVREFQRQIGLLDGLSVEFFDGEGHVLGQDEELGVEWPYTKRTKGRVTVGEWRSTRIALLLPKLQVWVMSGPGHAIGKHVTLKKVRSTWGRAFEHLIAQGPFEMAESAIIVIGDRNLAAVPTNFGDKTTAEGAYGLAVVAGRPEAGPVSVRVTNTTPEGMILLAEVRMKVHSRVLRIQDTRGEWHTDIPCKKPQITVYGNRGDDPGEIAVVVNRRPDAG